MERLTGRLETLLERHRPVYVLDRSERSPVAGVRGSPPASYGRAAPAEGGGRWLQYWRWHADNPQDRGILRSGRHEGDWELVQVRVDARGRPTEDGLRAAQRRRALRLAGRAHARQCARGLPGQRVARRLLPPRRGGPDLTLARSRRASHRG